MAFAPPCRALLWFVGERRQGKAAVGKAHPLGIVREHLVCRFNHHTFMFGDGLSARLLNAVLDDELVNFSHVGTVHECGLAAQPWSLRAQATRRYLTP